MNDLAIQTWLIALQQKGRIPSDIEGVGDFEVIFNEETAEWIITGEDEVCWVGLTDNGFVFGECGKETVKLNSLRHLLELYRQAYSEYVQRLSEE